MIYVDDMMRPAQVGGGRPAKWSHLLADTSDELAGFARALGLNPKWLQHAGTHREHYDVTATVRARAIHLGAEQIDYPRGTAAVLARKKAAHERQGEELWYASWRCNCTILARTKDEIPAVCPHHDSPQLAPPEPTGFLYGAALGIQPDHRIEVTQ